MNNNYEVYSKVKEGEFVWNPITQGLIFKTICDKIDFSSQVILDGGCGTGDFLDYLIYRGIEPFMYHGIDIIDRFLNIATTKLEVLNVQGDVTNTDLFEAELMDVDYSLFIASLEIMEVNEKEHEVKVINLLKRVWERTSKGIIIAAQSEHAAQKDNTWYISPAWLVNICSFLFSPNFYLDHSFAPNFFVFMVFKGETEWERRKGHLYSMNRGVIL